jgi:hypothetical protein
MPLPYSSLTPQGGDIATYRRLEHLRLLGFLTIADVGTSRESLKYDLSQKYQKHLAYRQLRTLLETKQWKQADEKTANIMLKIARQEKKGFLEAEDIDNFPCEDLCTIDQLWINYSNRRFGFSKQKEIYQTLGRTLNYDPETWENFGTHVGWLRNNEWINYTQFTFSLDAPIGHLPTWVELFNLDVRGFRIGRIKNFYLGLRLATKPIPFHPNYIILNLKPSLSTVTAKSSNEKPKPPNTLPKTFPTTSPSIWSLSPVVNS